MIHFRRLSFKRPLPVCHIRIFVSFGCLWDTIFKHHKNHFAQIYLFQSKLKNYGCSEVIKYGSLSLKFSRRLQFVKLFLQYGNCMTCIPAKKEKLALHRIKYFNSSIQIGKGKARNRNWVLQPWRIIRGHWLNTSWWRLRKEGISSYLSESTLVAYFVKTNTKVNNDEETHS